MSQPIHTLPPAELRGYARGLRETSKLLIPSCGGLDASASPFLIATCEAWEREAELIEGFAARLAALPDPRNAGDELAEALIAWNKRAKADTHAGADPEDASEEWRGAGESVFPPPTPFTPERLAAQAAALRTVTQPLRAEPMMICAAADAQCVAGCNVQQDGRCGRDVPHVAQAAPTARWYQPDGGTSVHSTLRQAYDASPVVDPVPITSSEWAGTRWVFRDDDGRITMAETREEATAYVAELLSQTAPTLTPEEAAQTGLADAVAEGVATGTGATWTDERDALLDKLYRTRISLEAMLDLLNALSGEPIASVKALRQRAARNGIQRAGLPLPEGYEAQPIKQRAMRSDSPWSKERLALLAELMPTVMRVEALLDLVNALPGMPIPTTQALRDKANAMGISRQALPIPAAYQGAQMSRTRAPQMAAPAAAPIVTAGFIPLTAEEMHNLRESFRKKEFGVTWLAEEYDMPPDEAQKIVDQLRNEQAMRKGKAA